MNRILRYTTILILFFASISSFAQTSDCAFKLEEAEASYETGILDSIPAMLRSCINNNSFDNEELSRAYKLLIKTYLFEDYQEMAELTMLKFLKKFPEYEIKPTDPVEFTYLYESYQTIPLYSIGVILGVNSTFVHIMEPFSVENTNDYSGDYSSSGMNMQFGIQLKRYINENIEINLDGIFTLKKFDYSITQSLGTTKYKENQSIISIPLTATYDFNLGIWSPYLRGGINLDYLLKATADFELIVDNITREKDTDEDIFDDRNVYNFSAVIGGGVKLNLKRGYIMADVRFHYGFLNNVNEANRFANDLKDDKYGYRDDNFTLNNLFISAGFVYPIYKTKQSK